ncbi:hypothetical protein BT67DRAFT_383073 [Trichocladium antarcticum]|uniref:Transcription factor RfeG n=1 Tax=Trichocladium antarcticum TaxID=1450529 RepID=A0AAN6ZBY5_9PEZI|nr:hypothetical protein BT67DRAFT_383073 [Trichocladium antarcticum]
MAGRGPNRTSQTQAAMQAAASARQNEYFVPRDGIDREVITSDICRYLGNDALVRPGTYESPDGRVTQGYFITAYRNLTSAMIQDLKADSARWEQERRAASRSSGGAGGTMNSSTPNPVFVRSSNSPVGSREQPRGQDYSAWKNRQREREEYEAAAYAASAMDIDYNPAQGAAGNAVYGGQPYPGGPPAGYPAAAYPPQAHPASQYAAQPGYGYPPNPPPAQYSPQPQPSGDRYSTMAPPPMPGPYGQEPAAFVHGSDYRTAGGYPAAGPPRNPPAMPLTSAAPSRAYIAPVSGAPGYGSEADPYGYPPSAGNLVPQAHHPNDALYGRGAPQRQGYAAPPEPQYDDLQSPPLKPSTTPTNATPAQIAGNGAPVPRRDRDRDSEPRERERERDHRDHRARRPEQERDERQERPRHRHR